MKEAQSSFLFVPHRAGTGRDDRRFINTHLSHRAAERRKRGKSRPKTTEVLNPGVLPKRSQLPSRSRETHTKDAEHESDSATAVDGASPMSIEDTETEIISRAVGHSPTVFPTGAMFDPFASTLIPMTPPIRALLHFNQDMFKPWAEGIEASVHKRAAFHNKFFQTSVQLLQDKTTGFAFLARLASMVAVLTSSHKLAITATGFKSLAYESLQHQMIKDGMQTNYLLLGQMFSLLAMEIAAHNFDAANIHAKTLQQLIQNAPVTDHINVGEDLVNSVLWHESLLGSFSLGRPVFEVDKFLDQASMRQTLELAEIELYSRGLMQVSKAGGFSDAGLSNDLVNCVSELRFMSDLNYGFRYAPDLVTQEVMNAFGHRVPLVSSRLLALYNDAQDVLEDCAYPGYESEIHTVAATCLAARFWYRIATSHEWVDDPPRAGFQLFRIYGTHEPVLKRLREAHEACVESGSVSWKQNLWLWILYIGTLAERANLPWTRDLHQQHSYFNTEFVALARLMNRLTWDDVLAVLNTFLYTADVGSRSQQCFEEEMRKQLKTGG
jgi:hypothetical protein